MKFNGSGKVMESYLSVDPRIDKEIQDLNVVLNIPKVSIPIKRAFSDFKKKYELSKTRARVLCEFDKDGVLETEDETLIDKLIARGYKEAIDIPAKAETDVKLPVIDAKMNKGEIIKAAYGQHGIALDMVMSKKEMLEKVAETQE